MTAPKVTPAMVRALDVLAEFDGQRVSYSNRTARGAQHPDGKIDGPSIYWQSADNLAMAGFAEVYGVAPSGQVVLTDAGRDWIKANR